MKNGLDEVRLFVYVNKCKVLNEAFKLTKLKDNGKYIEMDNNYYQHVGTAAGYSILTSLQGNSKSRVINN